MIDTKKEEYKPKNSRLRAIPKDVYDTIIDEQAKQKKKCNCQFSIEQTIYLIIRKISRKDVP